jgi:mycothiol synthase
MTAPTFPAELTVRAPSADDVDGVTDLFNACSMAELGVHVATPTDTRNAWQMPGFDRERDAWIVETPERDIAGYIDVWSPEPHVNIYADGCVHPAHRGRGIGRSLLRLAEARGREIIEKAPADMRILLICRVNSANESVKTLLQSEGYALRRHFWQMAIQLDQEPPRPTWPDGITVRTMVPGQDERAVYEADEEAFQDHFDHMRIPFEAWMMWETGEPDAHDPSLWFLAMDGDEIAGVALCRPRTTEDPEEGWVMTLGVRRPWRRRGLGEALLRHSFRTLYERGLRKVGLGVDAASLTGATRLYARVGMHVVRQTDQYAKELRPGRVVDARTDEA